MGFAGGLKQGIFCGSSRPAYTTKVERADCYASPRKGLVYKVCEPRLPKIKRLKQPQTWVSFTLRLCFWAFVIQSDHKIRFCFIIKETNLEERSIESYFVKPCFLELGFQVTQQTLQSHSNLPAPSTGGPPAQFHLSCFSRLHKHSTWIGRIYVSRASFPACGQLVFKRTRVLPKTAWGGNLWCSVFMYPNVLWKWIACSVLWTYFYAPYWLTFTHLMKRGLISSVESTQVQAMLCLNNFCD